MVLLRYTIFGLLSTTVCIPTEYMYDIIPYKMRKILVTGGAGFIGSAVTHVLVKQHEKVVVLDNESRGKFRRLSDLKGKIELLRGDIRDPEVVRKACVGVTSIIHLAAVNGTQLFYSHPDLVLEVGVKGILNIIDESKKGNIEELFFASSSEVYQMPPIIPTPENVPLSIPDSYNPRFSYAGSKIISELLIIHLASKYIKKSIIFRPHNVYGPDMGIEHVIPQFILRMQRLSQKNIKKLQFPIQGTGNQTRSFIYIADFVQALLLAMKKGKNLQTYHIGTKDEVSIAQVAKEIAKNFNKNIIVSPGKTLKGSTLYRCPDVQKIGKLGFEPKVSFAKGIQKTVKWYNMFHSL